MLLLKKADVPGILILQQTIEHHVDCELINCGRYWNLETVSSMSYSK